MLVGELRDIPKVPEILRSMGTVLFDAAGQREMSVGVWKRLPVVWHLNFVPSGYEEASNIDTCASKGAGTLPYADDTLIISSTA